MTNYFSDTFLMSPFPPSYLGPSELGRWRVGGSIVYSVAKCRENVGNSAPRSVGMGSPLLKCLFISSASLASGFLGMELTVLFAGIKVCGS